MQKKQTDFLKHWFKNPFEPGTEPVNELKRLAEKYPASNFIQAFLARNAAGTAREGEQLLKSAVYSSNREALYFLLHEPARFLQHEMIIPPKNQADSPAPEVLEPEKKTEEDEPENPEDEDELSSGGENPVEENLPVKEAEEVGRPESREDETLAEVHEHQENLPVKEAEDVGWPEVGEEVYEEIAEHIAVFIPQKEHQPAAEIEDEVFEEISEAPSTGQQPEADLTARPEAETGPVFRVETVVPESDEPPVEVTNEQSVNEADASFAGENLPVEEEHRLETGEPERPQQENQAEKGEEKQGQQTQQPTRYHDDKMPYSFMWWLDKTRKEHAQTYQPYTSPGHILHTEDAIEGEQPPLEQQYIEHIFHLQSVEELDRATQSRTVSFSVPRKEDQIIEKFIREEPQISTPRPEKLDVENKARKSTEDHLEMVSETLASIYTEQMLYHKAIDTYQKLSLKYPDKSTYFAARIKELNEKI